MEKHKKNFSIKAAFKEAWTLFWEKPWLYLGILAIGILVSILQPQGFFQDPSFLMQFLLFIWGAIMWALGVIITIGSADIAIKAVRGKKPVFSDLWKKISLFWRYLGLSIILILGVSLIVGVLLLPAIISPYLNVTNPLYMGLAALPVAIIVTMLSIGFMFYVYVLIDHPKDSVRDQLKRSWAITEGVKWKLFGYIFAQAGVVLLGLLALGVGMLVALPVVAIATASVYESLKKQTRYNPKKDKHD